MKSKHEPGLSPSPLFIVQIYLGDRDRACLMLGLRWPVATAHLQNKIVPKKKHQIGHISWPQWQRAQLSRVPLLQSAQFVFWSALPNSRMSRYKLIKDLVTTLGGQGWSRLIDRAYLPECTFCWANSLMVQIHCIVFFFSLSTQTGHKFI